MLLRLKETKTILLPTLQHKFESFDCMQSDIHGRWWVWSWPSASRARARCPCPRTWMVAGPACRQPTLPKDASATSRVLPALRLQRHGFPQSTQPNSSFCHMTHCCFDRTHCTSFLHRSVHLGFEERLSVRPPAQWSRMLLFANHHLTLSVGICWNRA